MKKTYMKLIFISRNTINTYQNAHQLTPYPE